VKRMNRKDRAKPGVRDSFVRRRVSIHKQIVTEMNSELADLVVLDSTESNDDLFKTPVKKITASALALTSLMSRDD
jgi:hypothetical protein